MEKSKTINTILGIFNKFLDKSQNQKIRTKLFSWKTIMNILPQSAILCHILSLQLLFPGWKCVELGILSSFNWWLSFTQMIVKEMFLFSCSGPSQLRKFSVPTLGTGWRSRDCVLLGWATCQVLVLPQEQAHRSHVGSGISMEHLSEDSQQMCAEAIESFRSSTRAMELPREGESGFRNRTNCVQNDRTSIGTI